MSRAVAADVSVGLATHHATSWPSRRKNNSIAVANVAGVPWRPIADRRLLLDHQQTQSEDQDRRLGFRHLQKLVK